jgi:type VI secretion system protein ImpI
MSTLTLSIVNLDQLQHGFSARYRVDRRGCTVGSNGADWLINDREQTIAPIHCEIRWMEGSYCILDHCQRTYMNDCMRSLGSLSPRRLMEGDQLRIGAYRLRVRYEDNQSSTHSLEDLFNPDTGVLDQLIADVPAPTWPSKVTHTPAVTEICSVFAPAVGTDPLAALEAATDAGVSQASPLHRLITGERS